MVYRRDAVATGRTDPAFEVELNDGPRMPFRSTFTPSDRPEADGNFWYALDRDIVAQHGVALLGPPPAEVFAARYVAAVIAAANRWHEEQALRAGERLIGPETN